ncbi:MAG: hypothetical protein J7K81_07960 [Methanophagales archaeon]|nr:hypothetical protein [Methanophagales archaeon]
MPEIIEAYDHHILHLTQEANEDLEELTDTVKTLKDKYDELEQLKDELREIVGEILDEPVERAFRGNIYESSNWLGICSRRTSVF